MKFGAFVLAVALVAQGCSGGTNASQTSASAAASTPQPSVSAAHAVVGLPKPGQYAYGAVPTLKEVYTMPPPSPRVTPQPRYTPVPCRKSPPGLPATYWSAPDLTTDQREAVRQTVSAVHAKDPTIPGGPVVTEMSVVNDYARVRWDWFEAPGMSLLAKRSGRWSLLESREGTIGVNRMIALGVPKSDAAKLEADLAPVFHEIGARLPDSTTASARYWLTITSAHGPAWLPPVIGGGTLRIASPAHTHTFALLPLLSQPPSDTQMLFITPCGEMPLSFKRGGDGHLDVVVRYGFVGKGVIWWTTIIDAETGKIVFSHWK